MTSLRRWDRAAALPAVVDGRRLPAVVALPSALPSVAELFEFMRDAELRFATLRMRIEEHAWTTRGEDTVTIDVALRHPSEARVTTTHEVVSGKANFEVWISNGEKVRTYASAHKLGTERPVRNLPRGLHDPDLPGTARVYEPITALPTETLPETFIHPAGFCQNVLASGRCIVTGADVVRGREAIVLQCDHPRTTELAGDRPDFSITITVDRETGVILGLVEMIEGVVTRRAEVVEIDPDAALAPSAFSFIFPTGTTMLY